MTKYGLCLAAFVTLLVDATPRLYAQGSGSLRGQVHDSSGVPVPGAQLIVAPLQVTTSDPSGHFMLNDVPSGQHDIHVRALGYYHMVFPAVEFPARDTVHLAVQMVRLPMRATECMVERECQPRP